jgi:hypothetical protein
VSAQPFRLRPYGYNAAQKDKIEKQVHQLLTNGWIQESQSPYASPVLLVKKKTGDWRLCVDYMKHNALTIENKFPLPVIDELVGAQWFSTLDLSSGFHQILVSKEDVHKTAFQTHSGHYGYKVMPYGVTTPFGHFHSIGWCYQIQRQNLDWQQVHTKTNTTVSPC